MSSSKVKKAFPVWLIALLAVPIITAVCLFAVCAGVGLFTHAHYMAALEDAAKEAERREQAARQKAERDLRVAAERAEELQAPAPSRPSLQTSQ